MKKTVIMASALFACTLLVGTFMVTAQRLDTARAEVQVASR